jgi:hypothetical protein
VREREHYCFDQTVFAHRGIYRSKAENKILSIPRPLNSVNSALEENPEYGLVLVGHSLGAVSLLNRAILGRSRDGLDLFTCGLPSIGRSFRVYAYAACAISLNGSRLLSKVVYYNYRRGRHCVVFFSRGLQRYSFSQPMDEREIVMR